MAAIKAPVANADVPSTVMEGVSSA